MLQAIASELSMKFLQVAVFIVLAWLVRRLSWRLAGRIVRLSRFGPRERPFRPERQLTLQGLVADMLSALAFFVAILAAVVQLAGVEADTIVWTIGLLSAGFGFALRPIIADFLAGISFVFEDAFAVGEKVQLGDVEGVIETVNLRTTHLRSPSGELCIVPNGEIRVMRNYSRGRFSTADITLSVPSRQLAEALSVLRQLGRETAEELEAVIEPWQVISKSGVLGSHAELTLLAKTSFGEGADLRPELLTRVQRRLTEEGIDCGEPGASP